MVSEDDLLAYVRGLEGVSEREDDGMLIFEREKIFLCVETGTDPLRIELRCDRRLSETLQERYESVMESRALGRNGIEVICSGQLSSDEVRDLVRHAYEISVE
jgi:predicted DNA-binding protein (MmcQ/YjbR family)